MAWSSSAPGNPAPSRHWRFAKPGYEGPVTLLDTERHDPYERPPLSKDAILAETRAALGPAKRLAVIGGSFIGLDRRLGAQAPARK